MSMFFLENIFLSSSAAGWVSVLLLKAAAVLAAAWALVWLLRHRSAALRHGIWSLAVALVLLLPLLTLWLPAWEVDVPGLPPMSRSQPVSPSPSAVPSAPVPAPRVEAYGLGTDLEATAAIGTPALESLAETEEGAAAADAAAETPNQSAAFYLFALWGGGVVVLLFLLLLHVLRIHLITRRAWDDPGSMPGRLTKSLAADLDIRRAVRLLYSDRLAMPVTWGLWRPLVLLPEEATGWTTDRLRVVLLHELAHIKRWDYLSHLAAEIACALYWPNPLVWVARHRIRTEQEQACDDRVLETGTQPYEYAEHLLDIVRSFQGSRWALHGTIAMAREVNLKGRVRAILDGRANRHPLTPKAYLLVIAVLAGFALPMAAVQPSRSHSAEDAGTAEAPIQDPGSAAEEKTPPPPAPEKPEEEGPAYLWMEAEEAEVHAPMEVRSDIEASLARYLEVPDGPGNDAPEGGPGRATFTFEVPRPGTYLVWGRVIGNAGNDNSFYVSVDGGPEARWDVLDEAGKPEVDNWTWLPAATAESGGRGPEILRYHLQAGPHTLQIRNREDGTKLDRLLVTDDDTFLPQGRGPAPAGWQPVYLWTEAEAAALEAPMRIAEGAHASGRHFVEAHEDEPSEAGAATFTLDVPQAGSYVVWGRILAPDDDENSFFVSMDGDEEVIWDTPGPGAGDTAKRWTWDPVSAREKDRVRDPVVFDLQPGRHTLRVRNRESGTRLDGLVLTNDMSYRPRGIRPASPPAEPVYVWLEAEQPWQLQPPLEIGEDDEASGGLLVRVPRSRESRDEPPREGRAAYRFDVPRPGTYTVWSRVLAPDDEADSFWVRMNGGRWIRWNGIRHGERWKWDEVHDSDYGEELVQFELPGGAHTLEIAYREGEARLDKLLVTNDPDYEPGGPGAPVAAAANVEVIFR